MISGFKTKLRNSIFNKANTPLKRTGLVLSVLPITYFFITSVHWNLTDEWFLRYYRGFKIEKTEMPKETKENTFWRDCKGGWILFDSKCVSIESQLVRGLLGVVSDCHEKCKIDEIPHSLLPVDEWQQSFTSYIKKYYIYRPYGNYGRLFLIIGLAGLLMLLGLADLIKNWIIYGEWKT